MSYTVADGRNGVPHRALDSFAMGSELQHSPSSLDQLERFFHAAWFYTIGLIAALFAALFGAAVGGVISFGVASFAFDIWVFVERFFPEYGYDAGHNLRRHLAKNAFLIGATMTATVSFCVAGLRVFPNKGQIQSLIVLELVALPGIFAIAGDARGTDDYTLMFAGCGVLLAIAVLALKFPHWIYLADADQGG